MISTEGAALVAQILPVLLLISAVERRALGPTSLPPKGGFRRRRRLAWILLHLVSIAFAFWVEYVCVVAVASKTPLDPPTSFGVAAIMLVVGTTVSVTVMDLYVVSLVGKDGYGERQHADERKALVRYRAKRAKKSGRRGTESRALRPHRNARPRIGRRASTVSPGREAE
jgi:hypothetical protein